MTRIRFRVMTVLSLKLRVWIVRRILIRKVYGDAGSKFRSFEILGIFGSAGGEIKMPYYRKNFAAHIKSVPLAPLHLFGPETSPVGIPLLLPEL